MKAQDLKNSILQLAVQGKLVEQDPNDEPASVLLERIREERAQLIKEKKIKKPKGGESVIYRKGGSWYERRGKSEPACIDDEIPFDIPESWEWCRFESLLVNRDAERIPVSVSDREKLEKIYDYYGASGVIDKVDKYLFSKPLLLIGEDGANLINRSTPIAFIARGKYWVNNHAHVIDGHCEQLLVYVATYINSISLIPYITGTAQPKMNQQRMGSILVPVPPLAEQQRIVEKVDQIMKLIGA
jgi:type I restriction enzyme S subunit